MISPSTLVLRYAPRLTVKERGSLSRHLTRLAPDLLAVDAEGVAMFTEVCPRLLLDPHVVLPVVR